MELHPSTYPMISTSLFAKMWWNPCCKIYLSTRWAF